MQTQTSPLNSSPIQVKLRAVEPEDVDRLYILENDQAIWPFGSNQAPLSHHQLWEYANNYDANPFSSGQLRLIIASADNNICGIVDLYDIDARNSRAMVGIMIAPEFRNRQLATDALRQLSEYSRNILGLSLLAADIPADNEPSLKLFSRCGYQNIGERPAWYRRGSSAVSARLFQLPLR